MHVRKLFLFLQVVSNSELPTEPSPELKDDVMRVGSIFVSFVSAANSLDYPKCQQICQENFCLCQD